ncbi:hypothetical protein ABH920_009626 [Catenulispora sp. EB89]|uniref:hypothetical protein n=1 Tax=Catenulispora sp. EB89 TaxID=3156257 RepID=UPI0035157079
MSQDDQRDQPNRDEQNQEPGDAAAARDAGSGQSAGGGTAAGGISGSAGNTTAAGARAGEPAAGTAAASGAFAAEAAGADDDAPAGAGAGAGAGSGADAAAPAGAAAATTATASARAATVSTPRREFHDPGEGAPRYAATPGEAPRSGSEQSWSAEPNPGYQRDPAIDYSGKRVLVGTLVGALLIAAFVSYGARILANRSNNGDGSAPWTAAVEKDGAVVNGISAQGNGAPHEIPVQADLSTGTTGATTSGVYTAAIASCRTATAITLPVTTQTGTAAAIGTWSAQATASATKLRADAAALQNALNLGHTDAVASAANTLCLAYPGIAAVPPMPDAAGSQAWSSAATAFATAATESLRGVSGNPDAQSAAFDNIAQGDKQLDALSARIMSAT